MITGALITVLIGATVVRARYEGMAWLDIIAWPSRWLFYVSHGGTWGPTFSACVGLRVRYGAGCSGFWKQAHRGIDAFFWLFEKDHCHNSLNRTEAYLKRVRSERKHWGRPEA